MNKVISCGCIVVDGEKVLLTQALDSEGRTYWGFPKGHQEPGETDFETALREVKEEVGLEVEITDENPVVSHHLIHGGTEDKEIRLYFARPVGAKRKLRPQEGEIEAAEWFDFETATERLSGEMSYHLKEWQEALQRIENKT